MGSGSVDAAGGARPAGGRRTVAALAAVAAAAATLCGVGLLLQPLRLAGEATGLVARRPSPTDRLAAPRFPYDEALSRTIASLAEASYCGPMEQMGNWTCEPCRISGTEIVPGSFRGIHHTDFGDKYHSYVMLAKFRAPAALAGTCVVAVRGTERLTNVRADADFWLMAVPDSWSCPGCKVMTGVYMDWMGLETEVLNQLGQIGCAPGAADLVLTGHSAGGADAVLGAWSLMRRHGYRVRQLYTYESPRIGNAEFAQQVDDELGTTLPIFRVTHARDPIVHLPFQIWGYRHSMTEVFYAGENTSYTVCEGQEDPSCSYQYLSYSVADHCGSPLVPGGGICSCPGWVPAPAPKPEPALVA